MGVRCGGFDVWLGSLCYLDKVVWCMWLWMDWASRRVGINFIHGADTSSLEEGPLVLVDKGNSSSTKDSVAPPPQSPVSQQRLGCVRGQCYDMAFQQVIVMSFNLILSYLLEITILSYQPPWISYQRTFNYLILSDIWSGSYQDGPLSYLKRAIWYLALWTLL